MVRRVQRIVLVEPDEVLAEVTAFRLELHGYQVETVSNTDDAVKCIARTAPDLVITDLDLSGTSALSLIERLASEESSRDIPVMVLSVDAELDRVTSVHQVGAADFLVVPYQPDVLQAKVAKLLARPRGAARDTAKSKAAQA